jgi:hypothetical protein
MDPTVLAASGGGHPADNYLTTSSAVDLTQAISKNLALYGSYERRSSRAPTFVYDLASYEAHAGVRVNLTRYLGLRLGYGYADTKYGTADAPDDFRGQSFDTALDFNRPLSLTRRTTLKFNGGVSAIRDRQRNTHYVATGGATLTRELARSWIASIAYARTAQLLEGFGDPLVSDGVTASTSGLLARRLQLSLRATGSNGTFGFGGADRGTRRAEAVADMVFGVSRYFGLGMSYGYFLREYDRGVQLPPGFSRHIDSQSVQAYVTLWAPLFNRSRRPHASR